VAVVDNALSVLNCVNVTKQYLAIKMIRMSRKRIVPSLLVKVSVAIGVILAIEPI
jgi:hypothetical protein